MIRRNPTFQELSARYLFPEVQRRKETFLTENPKAALISLGIGDTTLPIPRVIAEALSKKALSLGTSEGYTGYGSEQGDPLLRKKIAEVIYRGAVSADEVFVSDGAKCDLGRLQMLFGSDLSIAVQDPAYPVYLDGSRLMGIKEIVLMACTPENRFFPELDKVKRTDLIYFCSPNNPTGAAATRAELEKLVAFARANRSLIIYDAAYFAFINDPMIPRSIYEIEGADEVAIETSSFSKVAAFTGVRLGWTVVPKKLRYQGGESLHADWQRVTSTIFNGASNIAQAGGIAVLEKEGWQACIHMVQEYRENAQILKSAFLQSGFTVFGGDHAPYLWLNFQGQKSWDMFHHFLEKYELITTPGSGFGPSGEGFLRLTAFAKRPQLLEACRRIQEVRY